jgi:hypothetical protein
VIAVIVVPVVHVVLLDDCLQFRLILRPYLLVYPWRMYVLYVADDQG